MEKQKLTDVINSIPKEDSDDDIDYDVAPLTTSRTKPASKKGKVEQIEWTGQLEALHREKVTADAARGTSIRSLAYSRSQSIGIDLKERFRAKSEKLRTKSTGYQRKTGMQLGLDVCDFLLNIS